MEGGTRRDKTGSRQAGRQAGSSTFLFSGGGEEIGRVGKEVNGYRASECNCCSRARRKTSIPPLLSLPIRWIRPTIGNGIKAREDIERMVCIRAHARVPRVGARGVWESLRGGASRSPPSMSVRPSALVASIEVEPLSLSSLNRRAQSGGTAVRRPHSLTPAPGPFVALQKREAFHRYVLSTELNLGQVSGQH